VVFDHVKQVVRLVVNAQIPAGVDARAAYAMAVAGALRELAKEIREDIGGGNRAPGAGAGAGSCTAAGEFHKGGI